MAFVDQMRGWIDKGLAASKEAISVVGEKAQQLGEKGVIKMEIMQLRSQIEKHTARLGLEVYDHLVEKDHKTVGRDSPAIAETIAKLKELELLKEQKEAEYKKIGGKEEDLNQETGAQG